MTVILSFNRSLSVWNLESIYEQIFKYLDPDTRSQETPNSHHTIIFSFLDLGNNIITHVTVIWRTDQTQTFSSLGQAFSPNPAQ